MAFKDRNGQPDFSRLQIALQNSNLSRTNPALFQTVQGLIRNIGQSRDDIVNNIHDIENIISIINNGLTAGSFLTVTDETATYPTSRILLAGTNVTFDDTVAGQRTVNVSGASDDYVVLTDGFEPPSIVSDGFGNAIYIPYTP